MTAFQTIILKINYYILNPLIWLLFAVALVVFLWGVVEFLRERDANSQKANDGKQHLLWGLVGMFIMVSAFAIMNLIKSIIGSNIPTP